jgi:cold-inducible RNA-binding protein
MFNEFGEVESLAWITDRDTGRFRGFCFVEMDAAAAGKAIAALDGKDIDGRNLKVNEAKPRDDRGGGPKRGGGRGRGGNRFPHSGGNWR